MYNEIQVSVIIPTHNNLQYLPNALYSVFDQGVLNIEVLIVDDGSTDGTAEWVQAYMARENRVRYLRTEKVGPAAARNYAAQQARGLYLAFLDADDIWLDGKLQRQLQFHLQNSVIALSFDNYLHINTTGERLGTCFQFWPRFQQQCQHDQQYHFLPDALCHLLAENVIGTSTVMIERSAFLTLGGFNQSLQSASDWEFWLRVARHYPVAYTHAVTMHYLMHEGSVSCNRSRRIEAMQHIIFSYAYHVLDKDPTALRYAKARLYTAKAEAAFMAGHWCNAFFEHLKAWRLVPEKRAFKAMLADLLLAMQWRRQAV